MGKKLQISKELMESITDFYNKNKNLSKTSKHFKIDVKPLRALLKNNNVKIRDVKKITSEIENKIVELYKNGLNIRKIKCVIECGRPAIKKILKKFDLKERGNRIYEFNENFFEKIDSEEKAYWLGFIFADGGVHSDGYKTHRLTVKLASKDESHLLKMKKSMNSNHPIKKRTHKNCFKGVEYVHDSTLRIASKKLFYDLCRLGCVPNKSLTLQFPDEHKIPKELVRHFIRGYFDGDGSVTHTAKTKTCSILGTEDFLKVVQKIINNLTGSTAKIYKKSQQKVSELRYGGTKRLRMIRDYLYFDSSVFLDRKYEIFKRI